MVSEELREIGGRALWEWEYGGEGTWPVNCSNPEEYREQAEAAYLAMKAAEPPVVGEAIERIEREISNDLLRCPSLTASKIRHSDLRTLLAMSNKADDVADEVLLLASYCGTDNDACTDARPCPDCLAMCNVFDGRGVFLRELGRPTASLTMESGDD